MKFINYKFIQNKLIGNIAKFQILSYKLNKKNIANPNKNPNPKIPIQNPLQNPPSPTPLPSPPLPSLNSLTKQNKTKYCILLNILCFYDVIYVSF